MNEAIAANLVPLLTELGKLALEHRAAKKLAEMDEAEALRQIAAATAAFHPKSSAEALAEGAAAAAPKNPEAEGTPDSHS